MSPPSLRVLHVVLSLEPGGMENGVVNLTNALADRGFETHVCCLVRAGDFAARLRWPDRVHVLGKPPGFSWRAVLGLARLLTRLRPDVVHTHNLGPLIYAGLATAWGRRAPILHGEHSLLSLADLEPRRLRQRRWFYQACRRIHTVSASSREELIRLGFPADKITVALNGVDIERFSPGPRPAARRQIGLPEAATVLGMVGRFGPYKRHDLAIETFHALAGRHPDLHLLLVGDGGPERDRVRALAAAGPGSDRIHFTGVQHDLPPFYRAMNLLLVPSTTEGLSNVVLEAMACATPALTHDLPGHREVIHDGVDGFIVQLHNAAQWVAVLEKLLADPARLATLGEAARRTVASRFSFGQMLEQYAALYRQVAGRDNARARV
ncbi:MAG: glycosyltransferase [Verrucomicrobiales bacterium]|nr:glycosyltransferase [Verrucomicrobiales bacterium]